MDERRGFRRHDVFLPVVVADDEVTWRGLTANISQTGALLWTDALVCRGDFIYVSVDAASDSGGTVIGYVVRDSLAPGSDTSLPRMIAVRFRTALPSRIQTIVDDLELFEQPIVEKPALQVEQPS